jgi:tetratricopeptide (TPR) repeat protein
MRRSTIAVAVSVILGVLISVALAIAVNAATTSSTSGLWIFLSGVGAVVAVLLGLFQGLLGGQRHDAQTARPEGGVLSTEGQMVLAGGDVVAGRDVVVRVRSEVVWSIPSPVRSFIDREEELAALHTMLTSARQANLVPTTVLYGLGGVGKTQLALAYAQRYRDEYEFGWWVPAETNEDILGAFARLGAALGLPANLPLADLAPEVQERLREREGWLIIFDNASDPTSLAPFLPRAGNGDVLITSRNLAWQGLADPLVVDLLSLSAAIQLLILRSGDGDVETASQLAEELGRLPLALEQAAAYTSAYRLSLARYLEVFRARRGDLLSRGRPLAYEGTMDTVFSLRISDLHETEPAAAELLEICSLLAPDQIPVRQLMDWPDLLPSTLANAARDPLRSQEVVAALYQAALLAPDVDDTVRIHRLVQVIVLSHLSDANQRERIVGTISILATLFPSRPREPSEWAMSARLLPHANTLIGHAGRQQVITNELGELLTKMGIYVLVRGADPRYARELHEQALAIRRRLYEGDHPDIAASLSNLADDLRDLGELNQARELHEQALAIRRRLYEGDHPDIAASLSNLADDLRDLGELNQARELHEQALAIRRSRTERISKPPGLG